MTDKDKKLTSVFNGRVRIATTKSRETLGLTLGELRDFVEASEGIGDSALVTFQEMEFHPEFVAHYTAKVVSTYERVSGEN